MSKKMLQPLCMGPCLVQIWCPGTACQMSVCCTLWKADYKDYKVIEVILEQTHLN